MAARDRRPAAGSTLPVRLGALLASLLAALGLVLLPSGTGGQAHADTGAGSTVTKSGAKGTYDDFSQLKVTVEQTANVRTQGVKVSWTGGQQTVGVWANYLQIMQCWGDASDGPTPEQCEYGGQGLKSDVAGVVNRKAWAKDPLEPAARDIPFTTVKGESSTDARKFFTGYTTNEQDRAIIGGDGGGDTIFQLEDANTSPILGCGTVTQTGRAPEPCWLVVVPRGTYEPDGSLPPQQTGFQSSPLSAGNWAQRIVFRLDFHPTDSVCPIGQDEQPTTGSDMIVGAMTSWEPAMCTTNKITYVYYPQAEDDARGQILDPPVGTAGLAFVENPAQPPPDAAPVVHAPVAVSGLVIGYNIQLSGSSQQVPRIRLNARLVAKMLTQSYKCDVPGDSGSVIPPGKLSAKNARDLSGDPEFQKLNPGVRESSFLSCGPGLTVPQGTSDTATQLWRWLRSDPDAKSFLAGEADPWGMQINPYYLAMDPAHSALHQFWKPDATELVPDKSYPDLKLTSVALNPYTGSLGDVAKAVRGSSSGSSAPAVDPVAIPPALEKSGPQPEGSHFYLGLTDAAGAANYRLGTAELLNADGQFVAPTPQSLGATVAGMKDGPVPGVLDADPGLRTPGAYPLTTVTYAAASTSMDAARRQTYAALMRYAVGAGQAPGIGDGQLPPGYAPLTQAMRDQGLAASTALLAGAPPTSPADADSSGGGSGAPPGGDAGPAAGAGPAGGGTSAGAPPTSPAAAAAAGGTSKGASGGGSASPPVDNAARTSGTTPGALLGAVRWVLLIVLIAGVAGSLGGPLLMRAGLVRGTGRAFLAFRGPSGGTPAPDSPRGT